MLCAIHGRTHTEAQLPSAKYEPWDGLPVAAVSTMGGSEELYNTTILQGTAWNLIQDYVLLWVALHPNFGFVGALGPCGCRGTLYRAR